MEGFSKEIEERVQKWLKEPYDEATRNALKHELQENPDAVKDAFYSNLSFGTAGMRGLMGIGTNRLNTYTIQFATQGLANYILKQKKPEESRVAICYDNRHYSAEFAKTAASVLAGNGITVYLSPELRPTPFLSFICREKKCIAAIMITASHNPPEYNGYKVYWEDGAQVLPPHDKGIISEVVAVDDPTKVKSAQSDLIHMLTPEDDEAYFKAIAPLRDSSISDPQKLKILFSNLHGTGVTLLPKALELWGFTGLQLLESQKEPNGDFPTAKTPNPEEQKALQPGIDELVKSGADIMIATDPDADRLGLVVMHEGNPVIFNGNQIAAILAEHLCATRAKTFKRPALITTIVSTELLKEIAKEYQVAYIEVLTGFKYIGEKIHEWEESSEGYDFLFGAEESHGYLVGTHARDKDAIIIGCLLAELASKAKQEGKTLVNRLHEIYERHGYYFEKQIPVSFPPGSQSLEKMKNLMQKLRASPPKTIKGQPIEILEDYLTGTWKNLREGKEGKLNLPKSDVLVFRLSDGTRLTIRPSGTEPKVKIYGMTFEQNFTTISAAHQACETKLFSLIKALKIDHLSS